MSHQQSHIARVKIKHGNPSYRPLLNDDSTSQRIMLSRNLLVVAAMLVNFLLYFLGSDVVESTMSESESSGSESESKSKSTGLESESESTESESKSNIQLKSL